MLKLNFNFKFTSMLRSVGIEFTASAMDMVSVDFLHSIDVPFIKVINQHNENDDERIDYGDYPYHIQVGSGDINHLALHTKVNTFCRNFLRLLFIFAEKVARTERPLVVSTGMSNMSWVGCIYAYT